MITSNFHLSNGRFYSDSIREWIPAYSIHSIAISQYQRVEMLVGAKSWRPSLPQHLTWWTQWRCIGLLMPLPKRTLVICPRTSYIQGYKYEKQKNWKMISRQSKQIAFMCLEMTVRHTEFHSACKKNTQSLSVSAFLMGTQEEHTVPFSWEENRPTGLLEYSLQIQAAAAEQLLATLNSILIMQLILFF